MGSRLPCEWTLCERLGIGRPPLWESLESLDLIWAEPAAKAARQAHLDFFDATLLKYGRAARRLGVVRIMER